MKVVDLIRRAAMVVLWALLWVPGGGWAEDASNAIDATLFESVVGGSELADTLFEANVAAVDAAPLAGQAATYVMIPQEDYAALKQLVSRLRDDADGAREVVRERVHNELIYIILLCLLSVTTTTIILLFMRTRRHDAKDIVNAAGLNLIIIGTIILVLVVDTSEQLTAAIGVLGAIAGYLFRSMQDEPKGEGAVPDVPGKAGGQTG